MIKCMSLYISFNFSLLSTFVSLRVCIRYHIEAVEQLLFVAAICTFQKIIEHPVRFCSRGNLVSMHSSYTVFLQQEMLRQNATYTAVKNIQDILLDTPRFQSFLPCGHFWKLNCLTSESFKSWEFICA